MNTTEKRMESTRVDDKLVSQFQCLNEDVQLALNIVYFTFLKKHRNDREMFKEVCPTVYDMLDKIVNNPIKQGEIAPSFAFVYENFLLDLKVALLSEDGSVELIDKIGETIEILRGNNFQDQEESQSKEAPADIADTSFDDLKVEHVNLDERGTGIETATEAASEQDNGTENRRGKTWTEDEENLIRLYFQQGKDFITIASLIGRTEVAIKARLGKLGLIDYDYTKDSTQETSELDKPQNQRDKSIEDHSNEYIKYYSIINEQGDVIYVSDNEILTIRERTFYVVYTIAYIFIDSIKRKDNNSFELKERIFDVKFRTPLHSAFDSNKYMEQIEDIKISGKNNMNMIKVSGVWYNSDGNLETIEGVKRPKKYWIASERNALIRYYHQGMTIKQLARFYERSEYEIKNILSKLRIL